MAYSKVVSKRLLRIGLVGLSLMVAGVGYRLATAKPKEDYRNYEVFFQVPAGWRELPKNPQTLLLARDPESLHLLRCSATQIVDDSNPEPEMDTAAMVDRAVENAQENQPEWMTERLKSYSNGKVDFGLFRKCHAEKTVIVAMAVRGNTTLVVSLSNTGKGAKALASSHAPLLAFLDSIDLRVTDKWIQIHEPYEESN